jgi:hypothetical protein
MSAEDAKSRQALKSELAGFVRDSSQELSRRIRLNLESNFMLDPQRIEELSQSGVLDIVVDQCRTDMQALVDEFLSGPCRTPTPPESIPTIEEDVVPIGISGHELGLPVNGFYQLPGDDATARWPDAELPLAIGEDSGWQVVGSQYGQFTGGFGL